jgi:hypothetical protein
MLMTSDCGSFIAIAFRPGVTIACHMCRPKAWGRRCLLLQCDGERLDSDGLVSFQLASNF